MTRCLALLAGMFFLSACTTVPDKAAVPDPESAWAEHRAEVQGIRYFRLAGRMSVVNGVEVWQINVFWQQRGEDFKIQLAGPFGSGKVQLSGSNGGEVVLESSDGIFRADSVDRLLYEQTGVTMPVSGLRYWLLGLPDPGASDQQHTLDNFGRLASINQDNWNVLLKRYMRVNGLDLPKKVFVDKGEVEVRLVVDNWTLGQG